MRELIERRCGVRLAVRTMSTYLARWGFTAQKPITAPSLIRFLGRLIKDADGKVFLILDNLPVHRSRAVQGWLAERKEQIEVFHWPPYSPELNPDEGLNADPKQAVTRRPPARSKHDLKRTLISHMRRLAKRPERIRSDFGHQPCCYAA